MWTATLDQKDATAKGGVARTQLAAGSSREIADKVLHAAVAAHISDSGHAAQPARVFPGATWVYCSCGAAFHTNKRG